MNRTTRLTPFGGNGNDQPSGQSQELQMYDQDPSWTPEEDVTAPASDETSPTPSRQGYGRKRATAAILGSLLVGGVAGAAILGPLTAQAASPTPSAAAPTSGTTGAAGTTEETPDTDGPGGLRASHVEAVSDASVVAGAIGITEAELNTALQGGQTIAAVAKAHNVDVQKVIDALVADGLSELAAEVKAGTLTQAQADAAKAEVTQRATDQVNGSFRGRDGHGGPGGHVEAVSDASVAAKAIGITEAELDTALQGGQTIAAVAKAHNVDVQKVIDAVVADKLSELAAEVKAGTLTQAQADAQKATVTQFATDQVNGTHR